MSNELIQWPRAKYWTKAFNPVVGCKKISEGCQNCYAAGVVKRFGINGGIFAPEFMPNAKPPKKGVVFVGNMTDIFGEWNDFFDIKKIICQLNSSATNLILTKRAYRLDIVDAIGELVQDEIMNSCWFGVTCENQQRAEERIPDLLSINVSHRWLSLEPLLGPVDLSYPCFRSVNFGHELGVDWVVVGAESGPNRRECKVEWIESIVEQCRAANVPVFVKQIHINGKLVDDINKFPEHLRTRQIPWSVTK